MNGCAKFERLTACTVYVAWAAFAACRVFQTVEHAAEGV